MATKKHPLETEIDRHRAARKKAAQALERQRKTASARTAAVQAKVAKPNPQRGPAKG